MWKLIFEIRSLFEHASEWVPRLLLVCKSWGDKAARASEGFKEDLYPLLGRGSATADLQFLGYHGIEIGCRALLQSEWGFLATSFNRNHFHKVIAPGDIDPHIVLVTAENDIHRALPHL